MVWKAGKSAFAMGYSWYCGGDSTLQGSPCLCRGVTGSGGRGEGASPRAPLGCRPCGSALLEPSQQEHVRSPLSARRPDAPRVFPQSRRVLPTRRDGEDGKPGQDRLFAVHTFLLHRLISGYFSCYELNTNISKAYTDGLHSLNGNCHARAAEGA